MKITLDPRVLPLPQMNKELYAMSKDFKMYKASIEDKNIRICKDLEKIRSLR